ncbi:MAG TPA: hypothetical protein VLX08_04465 [Steroidobacteraceae bacterium]|nr:hypothetical protein [Steroidobacteraceae bacterium]
MSNLGIVLYVVGALFTVYVVAATWRSKDAEPRRDGRPARRSGERTR